MRRTAASCAAGAYVERFENLWLWQVITHSSPRMPPSTYFPGEHGENLLAGCRGMQQACAALRLRSRAPTRPAALKRDSTCLAEKCRACAVDLSGVVVHVRHGKPLTAPPPACLAARACSEKPWPLAGLCCSCTGSPSSLLLRCSTLLTGSAPACISRQGDTACHGPPQAASAWEHGPG